ncbi:unnamed protein product, partial [Didymodactylos carnosus]
NGLRKRLRTQPVLENITFKNCEVVLHRLKRQYIEDIMKAQQEQNKSKSIEIQQKITSTMMIENKSCSRRKKKNFPKRVPSPPNEIQSQVLPVISSHLPTASKRRGCDVRELTNLSSAKSQKMIRTEQNDCIIEDTMKDRPSQLSKFDYIFIKCFVCGIRNVLSFERLLHNFNIHRLLHNSSNLTLHIYDTIIDNTQFRMVDYFIPSKRHEMEDTPLNIFINKGQKLNQNQKQQTQDISVVIISDDEDDDIICLD